MAYEIERNEGKIEIDIEPAEQEGHYTVRIGDQRFHVDALSTGESSYSVLIDGRSYEVDVGVKGDHYRVVVNGEVYPFELRDERRRKVAATGSVEAPKGEHVMTAPMAGRILDVGVGPGESIEKGQGLLVIEAMKMENELKSPIQGVVKEVYIQKGDAVEPKQKLLLIEPRRGP